MTTIIILLFLANLILGVKLFLVERKVMAITSTLYDLMKDITGDFNHIAKCISEHTVFLDRICGFLHPRGFLKPSLEEIKSRFDSLETKKRTYTY